MEALEEEVARLAARLREREGLEARLKEVEAQRKGVAKERERLHRLVESGADLHEGPRRVRGLSGVLGVVADLLRPEPGLEQALEAALGPRLQWVLVEDEEAAKRAIAHLKRVGGGPPSSPSPSSAPAPSPSPSPSPASWAPPAPWPACAFPACRRRRCSASSSGTPWSSRTWTGPSPT